MAIKKLSKKGIFFTMIAIMLMSTVMYSIKIHYDYALREKATVIENRISVINNFINDLDDDINRGLYISSYRAIFNEINYVSEVKGQYLNNSEATFKELVLNGTISRIDNFTGWMYNNTLYNWTQKMVEQGDLADIILEIKINDINLYQTEPWKVTSEGNFTIRIKDKRNTANWTIERKVTADISILDFEDVLYSVSTNGQIINLIRIANQTNFVNQSDDYNTDELLNHATYSFYINSTQAPDFLMRLEGNLGPSNNGIESLVYLPELWDEEILTYNKTAVDYLYFNYTVPDNTGHFIDNMPDWFKIDTNHLLTYNVENLTIN